MCGRNSLFTAQPELESRFESEVDSGIEYRPRFNIAPGSNLEVITHDESDVINQYHWGLLPVWAGEVDDGLINARSETPTKNTPSKTPGRTVPASSSPPGSTNGKAPTADRNNRTVSTERVTLRSPSPDSGKRPRLTAIRFLQSPFSRPSPTT